MHRHIRIKHRDKIPNNEGNSISDQKNCQYCQKMVNKNDWNKHNELCVEASKYVDGQICLICDTEFQIVVEALNHIKKEHIDLISVTEKPSEIVSRYEVKDKGKEDIIDPKYFNKNMNSQYENVNLNVSDRPEPVEVTTIFKCPMCYKKYLSAPDVETHISSFHRIPIEIQKQGGISAKIIEEIL